MRKGIIRFILMAGAAFATRQVSLSQDTLRVEYGGIPVYGRIVDGDTILISSIQEATITPVNPEERFATKRELRQYTRLIYNVKKAYPYAKIAGEMFDEVEINLLQMTTEKEKKEYIKQVEDDLKDRFEGELKQLTITQGRILIKLIDRETMHTSYELVQELRGSFQAFFLAGPWPGCSVRT